MQAGIQFENANELRKYPLSEKASCVDDSGNSFPDNVVVDFSVASFSGLDGLRISSVHVGPGLVSTSFSDNAGIVATATSVGANPYSPVKLDPLRKGVSGYVSFGEFDKSTRRTYRFSSPEQSAIHEFCIFVFPSPGVVEFVDDTSGEKASGDVVFDFGRYMNASLSDDRKTITLSVSDGVARTLDTGCVPTDLNKSCLAPVIQSIDGVEPDSAGEIAIVFE